MGLECRRPNSDFFQRVLTQLFTLIQLKNKVRNK